MRCYICNMLSHCPRPFPIMPKRVKVATSICKFSHEMTLKDNQERYSFLSLTTSCVNTLRPRQKGRHFPDDIFKFIFLNENVLISMKISLKFVPGVWINNILVLGQIMAWCRLGNKPLSEPMMVSLLMHICVTQPQWLKTGILREN